MSIGKTIRRVVLFALGVIVILLAAAFILIHTNVVANYLRAKIVQVAEAKLGRQVRIQNLSIPWTELAVEIHGLTINGSGARSRPRLLQIPDLTVALAVGPLLSGHLAFSHVTLNRPAVNVDVNSKGESNFPKPITTGKPAGPNSSSAVNSIFSLNIRHLQISRATISYEDARVPFSVDLADFTANAYFDGRSEDYYGSLGYKHGWITAKNFESVEHSANLHFTASRSGVTCDPLTIALPDSKLNLYATVQNYSDPRVSGKYEAQIATPRLAQLLRESEVPRGTISTAGTIQFERVAGKSLWDAVQVHGALNSSRVALELRDFTAPVNDLQAGYALENGNLRVAGVRGELLGGELSVRSGVISLNGESASELHAILTNLSLHDVGQALPSEPYRRLNLIGRADLSAQLSWMSHFNNLVVDANANIRAASEGQRTNNGIPLNGAIRIAYDHARDRASLGNSQLQIGKTTISATGVLSKDSHLTLAVAAGDLDQFSSLVEEIEQAASSKSPPFRMPKLQGNAQFNGLVYGSLHNAQASGHLTAHDLEIDSTLWKAVQANIAFSPSRATLTNGSLLLASQGRINVDASVGLRHWSMAPSSLISLHAAAANVPISSLQRLAHIQYPVQGTLSANLSVTGTRHDPAGNGWIRVQSATAWNQPLSLASINLRGDADALRADLAADSPAGPVAGTLVYHSSSRTYQLKVETRGLKLGRLEIVQARNVPLQGTLVASGSGSGTIDDPEFALNVNIPELQFHGASVSSFQSQLNIKTRHVNFAANADLYRGHLQARGDAALTGQHETTATLDLHSVSVGILAARYLRQGQPAPQGQADLHVEVQGPLKEPSQLSVRAEVPTLTLEYQPVRLALAKPLVLNYRNGIAMLEQSEIKGTGIDLTFGGQVPVKSSAPFNITANGAMNLNLLQAMTSGIQSSGQAELNIAAQGTLDQPDLHGALRLHNVSLSTASFPIDLQQINGEINVAGRHMQIANLNGDVNGGSMNAQGSVNLGKEPNFDLAVAAQSVDIDYPAGVRARLDGNLRLNGSASSSALAGRVVIDYLGFTQQMDVASLASQFSSSGSENAPSPFESHMKLNIALQSSSTLSLASSQLSIQGAANLDVVGTLADPVVLGRATLTSGELFFLGKRYEIKSGTIAFADPARTRPSVDLYATTTVNEYKISLHFLGPVDEMKASFTSTPPLPQADIVNLLAFGQTTEAAATNPTPGGLGAESVLARGVASQISGKIQKLAGISQLSITPVLASTQQNPGAQVAIQQRVSGRLLFTFTTNSAETQNTAVQVQYQLGRGLWISALRDQNGGYGVDVHIHKSF